MKNNNINNMGNNSAFNQGADNEQEEINLKEIFIICFQYRFWFGISAIIMLLAGIIYVKSTPNIYSRSATVIVKDEKRGGSVSEAAAFQEIFSMGGGSVYNEIGLFKSNRFMYEVVERLGLEIDYRKKVKLRTEVLYNETPIRVNFGDIVPTQVIGFTAEVISSSQLAISELIFFDSTPAKNHILLEDCVANLGVPVVTPYGQFTISPTLFMNEAYVGEKIFVLRSDPREVGRAYNKILQVTLVDKFASLVTISIEDESISRAEDVINTLIQVYSDDAINDKNTILTNTTNFIDDRLAIIESDLTAIDLEIESFKKDNNLTDIASEGTMHLQSMSRIDQESLTISNELSMARYMKEYLEDDNNLASLLPVNLGGAGSTGLQQQITMYNEYMNKRNQLVENSSVNNPLVINMQNILVGMRSSILLSVNNLIESLEIQERNYTRKENEKLDKIKDIPSQQKYIVSVMRQQTIKEQLYLYLLNKKEESELQQSITESNCRIVDSAEGSMRAVAPNKKLIVLFALIIGLMIPAGVIYLIKILDTTINYRNDVKGVLSVPYLGDTPLDKSAKKSKTGIVVEQGSRNALSESFKIIRDNIDFMSTAQKGGRVIQLTSLNPESGKTFVSTNLAMSMALGGAKVIIVDLDIRKGTLSKQSGVGIKVTGATQYLSGKVNSIDEIIRPFSEGVGFDIVSSGSLPPNPSELLKSDRLAQLLDELRSRYDYVFIDNPPYGVVVDAAICARLVDQSIYVIRAGKFDKRFIPDVQDLYNNNKLPNMSLLLNGIDLDAAFGYNTKKSYSYGYTYGVEEKKRSFIRRFMGI